MTATIPAADAALAPEVLRERLRTVADTLLPLRYDAWAFGDSIAFEGMLAASELLDEPRWASFAHGFVRAWAVSAPPYERLDCTAAGLAMTHLGVTTGDARVLEAAIGLADYLVARPRIGTLFATWDHSPLQHPYGPDALPAHEVALVADPPPGAFIDCLHFDPPFLVAIGRAVGRDDLVEEGVSQALAYIDVLQRPDGLFDHFVLEGVAGTFGPGWGRGQGWALLGLLDVLGELPADHDAVPALRAAAAGLVDAMVRTQREDGHWTAIVHVPDSGDETSTAAFMADGFLRALRLGVVASEHRAAVGDAATRALVAALRDTDDRGILRGVSAAVNACTLLSHYAHVPRDFVVPWGQGPLAMAIAERLRADGSSDR